MKNLNVEHYLRLYSLRKEIQVEGITNPGEEIRKFTKDFVEKLQNMPLDAEITLTDNAFSIILET